MFGKRQTPPRAKLETFELPAETFPWDEEQGGDAYVACNLAAGNIANNLAELLTTDGRIHADTYVAAVGIMAGHAAQATFLGAENAPAMQVATTATGRRFLFGEPLNDALYGRTPEEAAERPINTALGAAMALGMPALDFETLGAMFAHVSRIIGDDAPFYPSLPAPHRPLADGDALLSMVWPFALRFLNADFDAFHRRWGPVPVKWRRAVCAQSVGRAIHDVKAILAPEIAARIMIESAIYGSKVLTPGSSDGLTKA